MEGRTKAPAGGFQVAVNDYDFRLAIGAQHIVEETITCLKGMPQEEDAFGMCKGLGRTIPGGDVAVGYNRFQLQRRHKRGNGNGQTVSFETEFFCEAIPEEVHKVEGVEVVHTKVVLILHIHVIGQVAVEV